MSLSVPTTYTPLQDRASRCSNTRCVDHKRLTIATSSEHLNGRASNRPHHSVSFRACVDRRRTRSTQLRKLQVYSAASNNGPSESHRLEVVNGTDSAAPRPTSAQTESPELWWKALKLPIFTVALVPLWVGAALAYFHLGVFRAASFWSLSLAGVLIIAWLNLSNDCYDAETGVDSDQRKPESVVALTGARAKVLRIALAFLASGVALIAANVLSLGTIQPALMLAAAVSMGHIYQAPPFRLSYKGLGEPLCFLAFGPLATTAFYLIQLARPMQTFTTLLPVYHVIAGSVLVGITTTVILFCAHFHQEEGDRAAGKMSPIVRLGVDRAVGLLQIPVIGVYLLHIVFLCTGCLPLECSMMALMSVPSAYKLVAFANANVKDPSSLAPAKIYATKWHALHGLLLAAGYIISSMVHLDSPYYLTELHDLSWMVKASGKA